MRYLPLVLVLVACAGHKDAGYSPTGRYSGVHERSGRTAVSLLVVLQNGTFAITTTSDADPQAGLAASRDVLTGHWELVGTSGVLLFGEHSRSTSSGPWSADDSREKLEPIGNGGDLVVTVGDYANPSGERFVKVSN